MISGDRIRPVQEKVDTISSGRPPGDKTELRSIVGKLNFYSRFIPEYSRKLEPIRELLNQNRSFTWKPYYQAALDSIIKSLNDQPIHVLAPRSEHKTIELHVMGDSLETLCLDRSERLICRASRFLSTAECNYSILEKQLIALVLALNKFKIWLDPEALTIRAPTEDLRKILELKNRPDRVESLLLKLPDGFDQFNFIVKPSLMTLQKDKTNSHLPEEVFYIDGSCQNNGGPDCRATWAICAEFDEKLERSGFVEKNPSNQSAELTAAVKACELSKEKGYKSVTIVTDSKYLHSAVTVWIDKWKNNNWLDHRKKPVVNLDLFKELLCAKQGLQIEWIHVKGHADSEGNIRADNLARSLLDANSKILCAFQPTACKLQANNGEIKELVRQIEANESDNFILDDGIVYYIDRKRDQDESRRIFVPQESRGYLLNLAHDNQVYGGHLGIKKTHRKLCRFWWPQMYRDIEKYIKTCDNCQRFKEQKGLPPGYLHNIPVSRIFQHLHVDLVGPILRTDRGNMSLITATDAFSKWSFARPVKNIKTSTVIQFLEECVISVHGAPEIIITDRGCQFTSQEWQQFLEKCKLKHNLTCAYHPQSNGTDERVNGTLIRILRNYVNECHTDWDENVKWTLFLYNTTVHESTGFSPYQILFGLDPRSPLREGQDQTNDSNELQNIRSTIHLKAAENIKTAQASQKDHYDRKHQQFNLKVGDLVLVKEHTVHETLTRKFYAKWDGPEIIVGFIGEQTNPKAVCVRDLTTLTRRNVAICHVKPYLTRNEEPHDPPNQKGEAPARDSTRNCLEPEDFISFDEKLPPDKTDEHRRLHSDGFEDLSFNVSHHPLSSTRRVTFSDEAETRNFGCGTLQEPDSEATEVCGPDDTHSNLIDLDDASAASSNNHRPSPCLVDIDDSIKDPHYIPLKRVEIPEPTHCTRSKKRATDPGKVRPILKLHKPQPYQLRSRAKSSYDTLDEAAESLLRTQATTSSDKQSDQSTITMTTSDGASEGCSIDI